ncbi:MAG: polyprenyl synthetase family protein [Planctomycetaceae bacterium]|nr:polyprenyl synthetase family protein [Planctomycetaceae bacterium]
MTLLPVLGQPVLNMPRAVPIQIERQPKENIPQTRQDRERIRAEIREFVRQRKPVPPLRADELRTLAEEFVDDFNLNPIYTEYVIVLMNSEMWRDTLAAVPYERRLLLLPKCLRIEERCPAPFDEFGLLCKQCGLCSIQDLQAEAERLGYAVLVAEGSALVMAIIETGKIEAIVGVSCLSVLEKAFPFMEAAAIPGVAIPLLQDDCKDVTVDLDWVWEVIHLTSDDRTYRMNLDRLREEVQTWFTASELDRLMGPASNETERLGREWLAKDGKRWRPFLSVCVWKALQEDPDAEIPDDLRKIAIAVECFHKASLIHDDIEDNDDLRYGDATLHVSHGIPMALNVGDLLLGEGYRLIAECEADPKRVTAMLRVAAMGHRTLCLGQGDELTWTRNPAPLSSLEVMDIFRRKTSPAFEVALQLGAVLGGGDRDLAAVLSRYSNALGIAYQIRDDVTDLTNGDDPSDLMMMRPTLPLALLLERTVASPDEKALVEKAWCRQTDEGELEQIRRMMESYGIPNRCHVLQESYKEEALRALSELQSPNLKGLLRRVVSKIFSLELKGWCSEFEARNGSGSPTGAEGAGELDFARR